MDFTNQAVRLAIEEGIKTDINEYWSQKRPNRYSTRISPSNIGEECAAKSWFAWRWAVEPTKPDGRMARYNSRGEKNEDDIIEWLRATGWNVRDKDPATGEQIAISDFNGHMYGKTDGIASHPQYTNNIELLLEFKYINYKRYSHLTNKVLQIADPKYYTQICLYMEYLNLPGTIFFPANRNDEDIKPIILPRDPNQVAMIRDKIETTITAKVAPAKIAQSPAFFACKFCDFVDVCHNGKPLARNCRSCVSCVPTNDGKFLCERWNAVIPNKEAILAACPEYRSVQA